jgi:hypothetical protein
MRVSGADTRPARVEVATQRGYFRLGGETSKGLPPIIVRGTSRSSYPGHFYDSSRYRGDARRFYGPRRF